MKKHVLSLLIIGFATSSVAPLAAADPRRVNTPQQQYEIDLEEQILDLVRQRSHLNRTIEQLEQDNASAAEIQQAQETRDNLQARIDEIKKILTILYEKSE